MEDFGFLKTVEPFAIREWRKSRLWLRPDRPFELNEVKKLIKHALMCKRQYLRSLGDELHRVQREFEIIEPEREVVLKTPTVFAVKELKPLDEMILGAVLTRAERLQAAGETDLHFCSLDRPAFDQTHSPKLRHAYKTCGLTYHGDFNV